MSTHCTIDLETLGTTPDAVILTLGAVTFNPKSGELLNELYLRFNVDAQLDLDRKVDEKTMEWWSKQDKAVMWEALDPDGRLDLNYCLDQLNKFIVGSSKIWVHGCGFDSVLLESIYRMLSRPIPWQYWQIQDSRTLFNLLDEDPRKMFQTQLHNALQDSINQSKAIVYTLNKLGLSNARIMG